MTGQAIKEANLKELNEAAEVTTRAILSAFDGKSSPGLGAHWLKGLIQELQEIEIAYRLVNDGKLCYSDEVV